MSLTKIHLERVGYLMHVLENYCMKTCTKHPLSIKKLHLKTNKISSNILSVMPLTLGFNHIYKSFLASLELIISLDVFQIQYENSLWKDLEDRFNKFERQVLNLILYFMFHTP